MQKPNHMTLSQLDTSLDNQVVNNQGGSVWTVDHWEQFRRFLRLSTTVGSFYQSKIDLTKQNAEVMVRCVVQDGEKYLNEVLVVAEQGLAVKPSTTVFALAIAAAQGSPKVKKLAMQDLEQVCKTPTQLFEFLTYAKLLKVGWGKTVRKGVAACYAKDARLLAYHMTKYRQRWNWTHRDVIRLAKPLRYATGLGSDHEALYRWAVKDVAPESFSPALRPLEGFLKAQKATTGPIWAGLVTEYDLVWEMLPTQALKLPEVWDALLPKMPFHALIRNIAKLTAVGLVTSGSEAEKYVVTQLNNQKLITKAKIHPVTMLLAAKAYASGRSGGYGKRINALTWVPTKLCMEAMTETYYKAYKAVEPTNLSFYLGVDVSPSMQGTSITPNLRACEIAGAMALAISATEPKHHIAGFCHEMVPLSINREMRLDEVARNISGLSWGGTDCAQPMLDAAKKRLSIDCFVIITDNETGRSNKPPAQALREYRVAMKKPKASLIVIGLTATNFTIADPTDPFMFDIAGCDQNMMRAIQEMALGYDRGLTSKGFLNEQLEAKEDEEEVSEE